MENILQVEKSYSHVYQKICFVMFDGILLACSACFFTECALQHETQCSPLFTLEWLHGFFHEVACELCGFICKQSWHKYCTAFSNEFVHFTYTIIIACRRCQGVSGLWWMSETAFIRSMKHLCASLSSNPCVCFLKEVVYIDTHVQRCFHTKHLFLPWCVKWKAIQKQ
jgi:hypothetical protein